MDIILGAGAGFLIVVLFWAFSAVMEWLDLQQARMRRERRAIIPARRP
jgi:hypothetical protein